VTNFFIFQNWKYNCTQGKFQGVLILQNRNGRIIRQLDNGRGERGGVCGMMVSKAVGTLVDVA
jgi:hypothetical protein